MASMKKFGSFSLLFLAIFALLHSQNAEAKHKNLADINPFCRTSDSMRLCNKMVKGATTLHDASLNAINTAIELAKQFQRLTPLVVEGADGLPQNTKEAITETCSEQFENAVEELQSCVEFLNKGDMGSLNSYLSASFASDCQDSLNELGGYFPLEKLDNYFRKVMSNTLAVVQQSTGDVV